jgi:hypothetical protein
MYAKKTAYGDVQFWDARYQSAEEQYCRGEVDDPYFEWLCAFCDMRHDTPLHNALLTATTVSLLARQVSIVDCGSGTGSTDTPFGPLTGST